MKRGPSIIGGDMKRIDPKPSYCVAIKEVRRHIEEKTIKETLENDNYTVEYIKRVRIKDSDTSQTVKVQVGSKEQMQRMIKNGIYIENRHYWVRYWVQDVIRCYKCQKFGHKAIECQREEVCAK